MYDYDDYYDENIYEPSPLDNLMKDYKEKCKTILLGSVQSEIAAIKESNTYLENENKKIRENSHNIKSQLSLNEENLNQFKLFANAFNCIKQQIELESEKSQRDNKIFEFLTFVFKQDYSVKDEYKAPLWIKSLTAFYSYKETVIEILRMFDCKSIPKNIENFRLPLEWNESEMDMFFDTLNHHSYTNGDTYSGNLQWYNQSSLEDVVKQCQRIYSQIPWQFVLRNPILKQSKYLERIGKEIISLHHSNGNYFYKICDYQDLSDNELKIIIDNLDYVTWNNSNKEMSSFILSNIRLIDNEIFLSKIYDCFKDGYDFKCRKKIFDMPFNYIKKWTVNHRDTVSEWLRDNKAEIDKEQRRELMEIILG